ncbi:hypothetical protein AS200_07210 [Streptomyces sp. CdTB01]|nr:hypothetical protein AS200_07210 [Streptomyces sp. CdTB01]
MPLVVVGISVLILLLLMTRFRLNGFAALLLVAVGVALVQGIPLEKISDVLAEGIGGQIGDTMLTIGLGAMVGRVMGTPAPPSGSPPASSTRAARAGCSWPFNLSVVDAIKARTTYTTVLAVLGLGGVLVLEQVLDALQV